MKILITGKPKSGKSTLLKAIVDTVDMPTKGLLTNEVRVDGKRVGFSIVTSSAEEIELAQTSKSSSIKVGKFFVNENFLNERFDQLFNISDDALLYIDEIGEMQLYSSHFSRLVDSYITSGNNLIATISSVFTNDQIMSIRDRNDVILLSIRENNRPEVRSLITKMIRSIKDYNRLDIHAKNTVLKLANHYLQHDKYTSAGKLFDKAITYHLEGRITEVEVGKFQVTGDHGPYLVKATKNSWSCECKLSSGRAPYKQPDECSHYQAVIIYLHSLRYYRGA